MQPDTDKYEDSFKLYCHWDDHCHNVEFQTETELGSHIKSHFPASNDISEVACHWDACHETMNIDEIMDHFKSLHSQAATQPHFGADLDKCSAGSAVQNSHPHIHEPHSPLISKIERNLHRAAPQSSAFNSVEDAGTSTATLPVANAGLPTSGVTNVSPDALSSYSSANGSPAPGHCLPNKNQDTPQAFVRVHSPAPSIEGSKPVFQNSPYSLPVLGSVGSVAGNCSPAEAESTVCKWSENGICCNQSFDSVSDLVKHLQIDHIQSHSEVYTCHWSDCQRNTPFLRKQGLERHFRVHAYDPMYNCYLCGRKYCDFSRLKLHMKSHTGDKPFECPTCKKSFTSKSTLKVHLRTHSGEKPLVCRYPGCNKRFNDHSNLSKHMKTHSERQHQCKVCEKWFTRKDQLARHMNTHAKNNPQRPHILEPANATVVDNGLYGAVAHPPVAASSMQHP